MELTKAHKAKEVSHTRLFNTHRLWARSFTQSSPRSRARDLVFQIMQYVLHTSRTLFNLE
jgi:hypothetical protein